VRFDADALSRVFGYTAEERRLVLQQMTEGREPILSMGHDTGLAALSELPQRLTRDFHQAFAQVTNPPMDPIREKLVMSLRTYVGRHGSLLEETPQQAHMMQLSSPVLSDADLEELRTSQDPSFRSEWFDILFDPAGGAEGMVSALGEICAEVEEVVRDGATIVMLSDRATDARNAPIPIALAVGAVHHHLIDVGSGSTPRSLRCRGSRETPTILRVSWALVRPRSIHTWQSSRFAQWLWPMKCR
jgi:hypothetical protein